MDKKINNVLFITDDDGNTKTYKVILTHHIERFNKDYAMFENVDDIDDVILFTYDEDLTLQLVQSEEECDEMLKILQKYDEENEG